MQPAFRALGDARIPALASARASLGANPIFPPLEPSMYAGWNAATSAPIEITALLTEFRMQRAIDFYLTGQRLGDLRRYAKAGTDLFPSGPLPVPPDRYGVMHCCIVPRREKSGNPSY